MLDTRKPAVVIIEAFCPACDQRWAESPDLAILIRSALEHTGQTGHVVVFNGATEIPMADPDTRGGAVESNAL